MSSRQNKNSCFHGTSIFLTNNVARSYDPDAFLPKPFDGFLLSGHCPPIRWPDKHTPLKCKEARAAHGGNFVQYYEGFGIVGIQQSYNIYRNLYHVYTYTKIIKKRTSTKDARPRQVEQLRNGRVGPEATAVWKYLQQRRCLFLLLESIQSWLFQQVPMLFLHGFWWPFRIARNSTHTYQKRTATYHIVVSCECKSTVFFTWTSSAAVFSSPPFWIRQECNRHQEHLEIHRKQGSCSERKNLFGSQQLRASSHCHNTMLHP